MNSYFDKLNLRPQERRLVVGILVVIFVLLNVLFVWPRFGDWSRVQSELAKDQEKLRVYNAKIAKAEGANGFKAVLKKLEGEDAQNMISDGQEIQLLRTVQSQVQASKVSVNSYSPITVSGNLQNTNEFFEEQSIKINVNTGEEELIAFLLNIGSGSSMIRVRDLSLKPADQNRYRLQGTVTLSANYQKKQTKPAVPVRGAPGATPSPTVKTSAPTNSVKPTPGVTPAPAPAGPPAPKPTVPSTKKT